MGQEAALDQELAKVLRSISHIFEGDEQSRRQYYSAFLPIFRPGETVLDLGCGDGIFLEVLKGHGVSGVGVEIDPVQAAKATARGITVVEGDLLAVLDRLPRPVDAVIMAHIIEHFDPSTIIEMIWRMKQELSPKKILIITPNIANQIAQEIFWLDVTHVRPYPGPLLGAIVQQVGFPLVQTGFMNNGIDVWAYGFMHAEDGLQG